MLRRAIRPLVGGIGAGMTYYGALSKQQSECHGTHSSVSHHHGPSDQYSALEQRIAMLEADVAARYGIKQVSGEADCVFSWDEGLTAAMPAEARVHERDMHGGFSEDQCTGKVYTGIPNCGLFEISADLKTWRKLGTDTRLEANIHGLVAFEHEGTTRLALAQNEAERVLIVGLDGTVEQELQRPRGGEFANDAVNRYYSERRVSSAPKIFSCTDVAYLNGKLYVVTGYSQGDFVLTAAPSKAGGWAWGGGEARAGIAWGGKGDEGGRFRTAHGIFAYDNHLYVANREAFQVIKFTSHGEVVEVLPDVPVGARICNVGRAERHAYFVMNALAPLGGADGLPSTPQRTAPIYFHTGERLVSTVDPGVLGIPVLKHLHHVHAHYDPQGQLYLLLHGWRDGKFAVLKHVPPN